MEEESAGSFPSTHDGQDGTENETDLEEDAKGESRGASAKHSLASDSVDEFTDAKCPRLAL